MKNTINKIATIGTLALAMMLGSCGTTSGSNSLADGLHTITIGETQGITLSLDKETAKLGEQVTITVESVPSGSTLGSISATANADVIDLIQRSPTAYLLIMPDADVTVSATVNTTADSYELIIDNMVNATFFVQETFDNRDEVEQIMADTYRLKPHFMYCLQLQSFTTTGALVEICTGEGYSTVTQLDYTPDLTGNRLFYFTMSASNAKINIYKNPDPHGVHIEYDSQVLLTMYLSIYQDNSTCTLKYPLDIKENTVLYLQIEIPNEYDFNVTCDEETFHYVANTEGDTSYTFAYMFTMPAKDVNIEVKTTAKTA